MKTTLQLSMALAIAVCLSITNAYAQKSLLKQFEDEFVALSETVSPSVVEISVKSNAHAQAPSRLNDMFKLFGLPPRGDVQPGPNDDSGPLPPTRRPSATGTGFFINEEGYIVTNNHVVNNAEEVTVELPDGTKVIAEVIGQDPGADIAVIKIANNFGAFSVTFFSCQDRSADCKLKAPSVRNDTVL